MKEIDERFTSLAAEGARLVQSIPRAERGVLSYYVEERQAPAYQKWLSGVSNLVRLVALKDSTHVVELDRLFNNENLNIGIVSIVVQRTYGILQAVYEDWQAGLLRRIEHMVAAETFDDFLDHAEAYHRGGKKVEAAVLAGAVLEDTAKRVARKNSIDPKGVSLDPLIDILAKANVVSSVKAKRLKAAAGVRNHALHAEWDQFDAKDAGTLIATTRDFLEDSL